MQGPVDVSPDFDATAGTIDHRRNFLYPMPKPKNEKQARQWKKEGKRDMTRKSFDITPLKNTTKDQSFDFYGN